MKYIGMDAHSRNCTFVVLGKNGKVLRQATVKTQEKELLAFVRAIKGKKALTFEEVETAQWLYLLLKDEVDDLVVCQPPRKDGPKTDKIDAYELADSLRVGRLKSVFHADNVLLNLRVLVSGYEDVLQESNRIKNRYKAIYRQVAISTTGSNFYKSMDPLSLIDKKERRYVAGTLFEQLSLFEEQRKGYVEQFESNVRRYKAIKLLTSIPGIGPVRANQIVAILVTPYRFPKKYNLFSYAMLTNHVKMSDGKRYGKQRARGRRSLKNVFKASTLSAMQSNTAFKRKYDKLIAAGKDERTARHAIAKMIAATVLGVWKSGKKYNDKQMEVTRRLNQNCHSGT